MAQKSAKEMTDEELDKELANEFNAGAISPEELSDSELDKLLEMSGIDVAAEAAKEYAIKFGKGVLDTAVGVGNAYDSVTGVPSRSAIDALVTPVPDDKIKEAGRWDTAVAGAVTGNALPHEIMKKVLETQAGMRARNAVKSFGSSFGTHPENAPEGFGISKKAGLSEEKTIQPLDAHFFTSWMPDDWQDKIMDKRSPAEIAGLGIDFFADYSNIVPGAGILKGMLKEAPGVAARGAVMASKVGAAGTDILTGSKNLDRIRKLEQAGKGVVKDFGHMMNPKLAPDAQELFAIAEKHGINPATLPESIEFGKESIVTRLQRWRAEGPLGETKLRQWSEAAHQVDDAIGGSIERLSHGAPLDEMSAGARIRDGFNQKARTFFDQFEETYSNITKGIPGLNLTPESVDKLNRKLSGIRRKAQAKALRGISNTTRTQGAQVLQALDNLAESKTSFKQMVEALRDIGQEAFQTMKNRNDVPFDKEMFRDLYSSVREALNDTVRADLGEEVAENLVKNNKEMSEFLDDKNLLGQIVGNVEMGDEQVFRRLVTNGNSTMIAALKRILSPDELAHLKGTFLETLVKRSAEGDISFRGLNNSLQQRNVRTILRSLFDPGEIDEIKELIRLGDRLGVPVLSTSGTGASNLLTDLPKSIGNALTNEAVSDGLKGIARSRDVTPDIINVTPKNPTPAIPLLRAPGGPDLGPGIERGRMKNALKASQVGAVFARPPQQLEGYPVESLIDVPPEQVEALVAEIDATEGKNSIEKAKLINLLRKHGKMPAQ